MMRAQSVVFVLLSLVATTQGAKVTPMEKVIGLLKDLSAKVTAEGAKEAAQYDKFACFCKEQADEKQYSIEKSQALEDRLGARIEEAVAEKDQLDQNVAKLQTE